MDDSSTLNLARAEVLNSAAEKPRAGFARRHWVAIVLLAAFWTFEVVVYRVELAMFTRFLTRMSVILAFVLGFFIWWLLSRQLSFRARLAGLGILAIAVAIAELLHDPSVGHMGIVMMLLPYVGSAWMVWMIVGRNRSVAVQMSGFAALAMLMVAYNCSLRMDGLDGVQRASLNWRWKPTPEDLFLASARGNDVSKQRQSPSDEPARACELQSGDWPGFRGADRDAVVRDVALAASFDGPAPEPLWRRRVGPGWSSAIIVDGFLVTQEQRGESEAVVCYEAATGEEVWSHVDASRFYEVLAGAGPRATPTFHEGRIYTLGASGKFNCLEAATGKPLWSHDIAAEAEAKAPQWGFSASPLVVDNLAIVYAGGEKKSLLAYRADSGELAWTRLGGESSYSSPQLVSIHGQQQILMHDNHSLAAVKVEDGSFLWERMTDNKMAFPMLQALPVQGNQLLIQSDPGVALVEIKNDGELWSATDLWTSNALKPSFNDFVVHEDHIYGLDDGILVCLDLATGKRVWKKGRYGHGQMLLLPEQGRLVILSEQGEVIVVAAEAAAHRELGRFQAIIGKTWNHPVIAHGHLIVRNAEEMACYRLPLAEPAHRGK